MTSSWMAHEIASVPELIARQAGLLRQPIDDLTSRLIRQPPQLVVTCGRGSSAHAGLFAKHVIELNLGIPVAPAAPSIASIYHRRLQLRGQLVLIISQSGTSDDLIEFARSARNSGALTVAVTNVEGTPLSSSCDVTLAMGAGPERSVPATKTFLSSLCVVLRVAAAWSQDTALGSALCRLPERLTEAANLDWNEAVEVLAGSSALATIGRGSTLAVAREAALKLKECCKLNAEGFSAAEFQHGPISLLSARYPVFVFLPNDAASVETCIFVRALMGVDARVLCTQPIGTLPTLPPDRAETDAICAMQSFYVMLVKLASRRGVDPDQPPHLHKVTRTR
jgi:glucosamine--fructose-6-phosphate aminotransferase (isomerizing)